MCIGREASTNTTDLVLGKDLFNNCVESEQEESDAYQKKELDVNGRVYVIEITPLDSLYGRKNLSIGCEITLCKMKYSHQITVPSFVYPTCLSFHLCDQLPDYSNFSSSDTLSVKISGFKKERCMILSDLASGVTISGKTADAFRITGSFKGLFSL
ncbi:hypothetical protein GEMRC1_006796 [Eukaryota sp. GEM-RC1]